MATIKDQPGQDNNIYGTNDGDKIFGLDGDDILYGRKGDDFLNGGTGDDWLYGGPGKDTFAFKSGGGEDQIQDFRLGADGLDIRGTTFGLNDLQDISVGSNNHDHDHDGNYLRQTSANGQPETQIYFHHGAVFDSLTILGITIQQLANDVLHHSNHYHFHA